MAGRNTVSSRIAETLRREIDAGAFGPVGRFPTERDLALRFGVARNTVRRAIHMLEADGRLVRHVGRGTFVAPLPDIAVMAENKESNRPLSPWAGIAADVSPKDLIDARIVLEPAVAASAAANATDGDVEILLQLQAASEQAVEMEEFERYDAEFHRQLFAMAHNPLIAEVDLLLSGMRAHANWLSAKRRAYSRNLKESYIGQHRSVIEAIRRRSPAEAREAMLIHLGEVRRVLLDE